MARPKPRPKSRKRLAKKMAMLRTARQKGLTGSSTSVSTNCKRENVAQHFPPSSSQSQPDSASTSESRLGKFNASNFENITAKCANCNWRFVDENERNIQFSLLNNLSTHTNEIQIIDAIFYIYGLTVADWTKTVTSLDDENSSIFTYVSEHVFEKGISFCSNCCSALEKVYTSHKALKNFSHKKSLFAKALKNLSSGEIQIKTEIEDQNEQVSNDDKKLIPEVKKENDLEDAFDFFETLEENFEVEDPLQDCLGDLQSNSPSHFLPATASENLAEVKYDLSTPDIKPKTKVTIKTRTSKRKQEMHANKLIKRIKKERVVFAANEQPIKESLWSLNEVKELNKTLAISTDGLQKTLSNCSVRVEQLPPNLFRSQDSFNIICCHTTFLKKADFIDHKSQIHAETETSQNPAKCGICDKSVSIDTALEHLMTRQRFGKKSFKCRKCHMRFKHRCGLGKHFKTHDAALVCDICEIVMPSEWKLIVHKANKHAESPELRNVYACNKCDRILHTAEGFRTHCEKHDNANRVTCNICERAFPHRRNFEMHMKKVHGDHLNFSVWCKICEKPFRTEYCLKIHKLRNECGLQKLKRFICEKCGTGFRNAWHLKVHTEKHEDVENPNKELFKCDICGKMLKHRSSLRSHKMNQHPKVPRLFFCDQCGKTTKNMTNMKIHMKVHEKKEDKPTNAEQESQLPELPPLLIIPTAVIDENIKSFFD